MGLNGMLRYRGLACIHFPSLTPEHGGTVDGNVTHESEPAVSTRVRACNLELTNFEHRLTLSSSANNSFILLRIASAIRSLCPQEGCQIMFFRIDTNVTRRYYSFAIPMT